MIGTYTVRDATGRDLSESQSFKVACRAVRVHLSCDGEEPPLNIIAPDGERIGTGVMDDCGRVTIRTTSLTRAYERVVSRWGSPE